MLPHHLQLSPIAAEIAVGIEVRVIAHDVLIRPIQPGVVVLVAELERRATRRIAEGLHAADDLTLAINSMVGAGLTVRDDAVDGLRDVVLKLRDYLRLLRQLLLLLLIQSGDNPVAPSSAIPVRGEWCSRSA